MPYKRMVFPIDSTIQELEDRNGNTYDVSSHTVTVTGEDGDIPILYASSGDEFIGEALEGQWHKGWDANISTFCATIDSGTLRLTGVAANAGTGGNGWINSHHPTPLMDELEYKFSIQSPIDDSGSTASRDIKLSHFIKQDKDESLPDNDDNFLQFEIDVDEDGLILYIRKEVDGSNTVLESGYDYTMDGSRSTGSLEATIWRIVFNGKPGTTDATMSVYLKQSDTIANAESATENEVTNSPFDISDLGFNVGHSSYRIYTENTTYFGTAYDSATRAESTYLRVNYPSQFNVNYDFTEASYGLGDVELYDGDPDTTGVRVYDEDHAFSNDAYIQNGLIRLHIDELVQYGLKLYGYYGAAWNQPLDRLYAYLETSTQFLSYPSLQSVTSTSPEQVVLVVRLRDSAAENEDYYIDYDITLNRGSLAIKIEPTALYPVQDVRFYSVLSTVIRFGYAGDNQIGDDDVNTNGFNTTLSDNFLTAFDDAGGASLISVFTDEKPTAGSARFQAADGGDLGISAVDSLDILNMVFWVGLSQFSNNSELFEEGETATLAGGATIEDPDAAASALKSVKMDAQNETNYYDITAGTNLPAGRYLAVFRMRDTNQVAGDAGIRVYNNTDSEYRNEEGTWVNETVTATYAYYSIFFDITDADVTGTDVIRVQVNKQTANANDLFNDYFLVVPIGDGENSPQDLSHSAIYDIDTAQPIDVNSLTTEYIGVQKDGVVAFFGGLNQRGEAFTLDDDETHTLTRNTAGFGFIQVGDNEEYAWFFYASDGTVTLVANSGNVDDADTDGDFCVYDGGDYVILKNRLGGNRKIRYVTWSE